MVAGTVQLRWNVPFSKLVMYLKTQGSLMSLSLIYVFCFPWDDIMSLTCWFLRGWVLLRKVDVFKEHRFHLNSTFSATFTRLVYAANINATFSAKTSTVASELGAAFKIRYATLLSMHILPKRDKELLV